MGRQVIFYMTDNDESTFLHEIIKNNHAILSRKGEVLSYEDAIQSSDYQLCIASKSNNIQIDRNGFIVQYSSDVIQYSRSKRVSDEILDHGRIYAELSYYDDNGNTVKKSKEFETLYQTYAKWLKKNMKISLDKSFYIGKDAYELYKKGVKMKSTPVSFTDFD